VAAALAMAQAAAMAKWQSRKHQQRHGENGEKHGINGNNSISAQHHGRISGSVSKKKHQRHQRRRSFKAWQWHQLMAIGENSMAWRRENGENNGMAYGGSANGENNAGNMAAPKNNKQARKISMGRWRNKWRNNNGISGISGNNRVRKRQQHQQSAMAAKRRGENQPQRNISVMAWHENNNGVWQ